MIIDYRSDAVTQPTEAMWQAMRAAPAGWGPAGDDGMVLRLERIAAAQTGMAAALFVPTATTANLVAQLVRLQSGDHVVLDSESHLFWSEKWGTAALAGAVPRLLTPLADGGYAPDQLAQLLGERRFSHRPRFGLIAVENTHNLRGGRVVRPERMAEIAAVARQFGVPVHLDGARLMNAAVALNVEPAVLAAGADSVTLGVSKGLAAPYGALLCGDEAFIAAARPLLHRLGGHSVPNSGIFAAAALVALADMPDQLVVDHRHARMLAEGLAQLPGVRLDPQTVETNIVMLELEAPQAVQLAAQLAVRGIRCVTRDDATVRFVTHRHITAAAVERTVADVGEVLVGWGW
jgi:threonine aldolase